MPNYRIRLKDTNLTTFSTTFETGDYTQVSMMLTHAYQWLEPAPILRALFLGWSLESNHRDCNGYSSRRGQNASSPYHVTSFNSALRYQSDSVTADGYATGTVAVNRSNMRLFMDIGEIGSLRGTVTTSGSQWAM